MLAGTWESGLAIRLSTYYAQNALACMNSVHYVYICVFLFVGEVIVSRYIAESIATDEERFGHVGLCQLCIYKTQFTKAYVAEASCISCY